MSQQIDLTAAAHQEMIRDGLVPDFPPAALAQVAALSDADPSAGDAIDLRELLWSSIDNPESRDLDQVEYAEARSEGAIRVLVGIADVDSRVPQDSPVDLHATTNTTSVYCGVVVFPMLPERLSTGLTSLNEGVDRLAVVLEFVVAPDGTLSAPKVYRALVHNHAKLDYPSVGAWLEGRGEAPAKIAASVPLAGQVRLQDRAAGLLRMQRHRAGALDLDTIETTAVTGEGKITRLALHERNRATLLIEDFMVSANVTMAQVLEAKGVAAIRRVVKAPERWDRLVALAATLGDRLPAAPDSPALSAFVARRRAADPDHFPDLSLAVVKLLGPGEYAVLKPGAASEGHFGLAVHDYAHSTAPNRRFADLVTQRLLKSVLVTGKTTYSDDVLVQVAARCTKMEDAARKVERTCRKQAAAVYLLQRVGETFDAIVTGANPKGTFVRTIAPPAEGMVIRGKEGMDVGEKVRVKLVGANPQRGFIDFARA